MKVGGAGGAVRATDPAWDDGRGVPTCGQNYYRAAKRKSGRGAAALQKQEKFWPWCACPSEGLFDLGCEFEGEGVETLGKVSNILKKIVVGDERRNRCKETGGGGDEGFGNAGGNGAEAGGAGSAEAGEGVDDAPDRAKQSDEGSDASSRREPGHALFDAAHFVGGGELHAHGDGLERLDSGRRGIARAAQLGLQFAIASGVDVGEGRSGGHESLRIGDAFGGAKDFEELIALATDTSEEAHFLEDEGPRDQGKEKKNAQNGASDPAGLRKNVKDVADEVGEEQMNDVCPSGKRISVTNLP